MVFEWDGERFVEFQIIPSQWAYNWHPFEVDDRYFVAHADHVEPSMLYRWDGERLVAHQELLPSAGRAFAHFDATATTTWSWPGSPQPPRVLRWDGERFVTDPGARRPRGARAARRRAGRPPVRDPRQLHPRHAGRPEPVADLAGLRVARRRVRAVAEFPTRGGTDVEVRRRVDGDIEFVVSNSLSPDLRFASETVLYSLSSDGEGSDVMTHDVRRVAGARRAVPDLHRLADEHRRAAIAPAAAQADAARPADRGDGHATSRSSPAAGGPPTIEGFRLSTRGFKEMAAVSHLGPALATLARMKELDPDGLAPPTPRSCWPRPARRGAANSPALWRERIAVAAFAGREAAIAAMVDYSLPRRPSGCSSARSPTTSYLTAGKAAPRLPRGPAEDLPVPFNRVMVATFFLTGMDIAHRLITWFDGLDLPWERAMVHHRRPAGPADRRRDHGQQQRRRASSTPRRAAGCPTEHLLIAPHAPVFPMYDGLDIDEVAALEHEYRRLWAGRAGDL